MLKRADSSPAGIAEALLARIDSRDAVAGVIGLGYVGLPLAVAIARAGFRVEGFDVDPAKPPLLNRGQSYIEAVSSLDLSKIIGSGRFHAGSDFGLLEECDIMVICVPTPLTPHRDPDLSFIENTACAIAPRLRRGRLVVLESTTYPGTTREVLAPLLEASGLRSGQDFFLGYSPEREDPGNPVFHTINTPKLVAGDGPDARRLVAAFYGAFIAKVVEVTSPEVAESAKITENIFRAVNIALVNELKIVFDAMGIDVWEVIEAAKTKPFGYMPFYPGPGLGGHCIPIDPFYLSWKSREFDLPTRFIELAGEINRAMPRYVMGKLEEALDRLLAVPLGRSRILILGLAFKKNVSDIRESPALKLIELLEARGARVEYHDPHVPEILETREHRALKGRRSVALEAALIADNNAVLVATDHDSVDYALIAANARLIVDTRNVFARNGLASERIVKA
ncbi:MAG: nucleotide sugar dehydrogenase [Hyphomicrobiales bacterium]